jgi:DNA invertase Pin-like site-specific DNA recombinase
MSELKITADHLKRDAFLYVRQSTLRQVAENGESTQRQYALRHRAIAAGWPAERVRVIDRDLGKSGSTAAARDGFQELVSEVALGKAGSSWAWRCPASLAIRPTGTGCSSCAR